MATGAGLPTEGARYSTVAIVLHWTIAALTIANLVIGLIHDSFSRPTTASLMFYHKAIGITVLALTLARLGWRAGHRPPAFDAAMRAWERTLARLTHWAFYLLLVALPMTGWMLSSSSNRPTNWFGIFLIAPLPVSRSEAAHDLFEEAHELLGYVAIVLIVLHVAGALKHHLQGHRQMMGRMAPWIYRRR